eukprot:GEZU01023700.1.p1 GENE.GEZU01023700.1~~GEZU01023700.1.p1  ORF type:complete len:104 (+),score=28.60 GEZU01023700.1:545-856(+)
MAEKKDLLITYLLWFFLGGFGIHRFYLERTTSGVVWLLTCALCGVGWLVDACLIPAMVEEHNRKLEEGQTTNIVVYNNNFQQPAAPVAYVAQSVVYQQPGYNV